MPCTGEMEWRTQCACACLFSVKGSQDMCVQQEFMRLQKTPREKSACDSPTCLWAVVAMLWEGVGGRDSLLHGRLQSDR